MTQKRIIGLTGGIATGKTTVSDYLAEAYQLTVLDADVYARETVQPGSLVLDRIVERYGNDILGGDRTLNRRRLGEVVFANPAERQWLEQQIHPVVRSRFQAEMDNIAASTVVLAIPLLFEAKLTHLVTEIWVVYCEPTQQLERIIKRDRLTPEHAHARISSQFPLADKVAAADVVLDNASTPEHLLQQVDAALAREM
ncbi:MAG: dephospho-CoA kinase [Kastovskya adunca ATA6-11-RM4]|jgi:dephospho-CoA kinase|nr:dephospho-CoA kinase [Kastovskya adunca ATA6-11-RM4]